MTHQQKKQYLFLKALAIWFFTMLAGTLLQTVYFSLFGKLEAEIISLLFVFGSLISSPSILIMWVLLEIIIIISDEAENRGIMLFLAIFGVNLVVLVLIPMVIGNTGILNSSILQFVGGYIVASFAVSFIVCRKLITTHSLPQSEIENLDKEMLDKHIGK